MKCLRNSRNQFHIREDEATSILEDVLRNNGKDPSITSSIEYEHNFRLFKKALKDPFIPGIFLCIAMLIVTLMSPVLLLILPHGPVIDEDRILAAKAMANRETYDVSVLTKGERDNTPLCLTPKADNKEVLKNEVASIDASNSSEGYIVVHYTGDSEKVKLRITGPDDIIYTYDLATGGGKDEVFPLQAGNGQYLVSIYENLIGTQYVTAFSQYIEVSIRNEFLPFLYPNQYVDFNIGNQAVAYSEYLAYTANNDLDVVSAVYNALISSMTYDYEEAETVQSGYIPDIDEVLTTGKGICLDYAALMTCMLRSQNIPTRMEVGYAGTAYHAWISTYIKDIGWVNGIIRFDGKDWSLMDPTFASTTETEKLASFIGDGENYKTKYIY